jgi:competence ComEA-like helix-hairpin-helix protein
MGGFTWREYFYYTRTERNGALTLCVILCIFFVLPSFYPLIFPFKGETDFSAFQSEIAHVIPESDSLTAQEEVAGLRGDEQAVSIELFPFDPNTAGKEDFIRLGLTPRLAQTLLNYRSKGGKFYKKEDLKKIYTLREEDYARLEPFIRIAGNTGKDKSSAQFADENRRVGNPAVPNDDPGKFKQKERTPVIIDVNLATQEEWQMLRGIGQGYARRIVNFREKLGGFYSVEQVGETYGLPDSTFQQIKPSLRTSPVFRKINVNACTLEELKAHPYFSNFQATVLFNYRQQHGSFTGMDDLKKVGTAFKETDWKRIEPYVTFE